MGHYIRRSPRNLFAILACVQPGVVVARLADIVIASNLRLTQENRIGHNRRIGQMIAVANEVLHDRSLIALRGTIPPQPSLFEVGRVDDQRIAGELACRKALERMRRPCPRMRTAVHPDDAVTFGGLCPDVNGYQALGMGIAFFPDPEVPHGAHLVRQNVRFTLMMAECQTRSVIR